MVSSILSEDEKVNSSITDICSPDTTYLDLMIMYAAKRKRKQKSSVAITLTRSFAKLLNLWW